MSTLTEILNDPEAHHPGNFDTPQRANALLTGLCQDAAIEIERLKKAVADEREAIMDEWWMCVQSDIEHGVFTERAAEKWQKEYPAIAGFAATIEARHNIKENT